MDGVLTDGTLLVMDPGSDISGTPHWLRSMHVRDGYALQLAVKMNYHVLIVSGSNAAGVEDRLKRLGVQDVFFSVKDKRKFLREYFHEKTDGPESALFMGDDIPDVEAMQFCGVAACPSDAVWEVKKIAHYISPLAGGQGCVRDVIEKVLRLQGKWMQQAEITST